MRTTNPVQRGRVAPLTLILTLLLVPLAGLVSLPAQSVQAAAVPVGQGSYTDTFPTGAAGVPGPTASPLRTSNVTGPVPTNDWWTSLVWRTSSTNTSGTLYAHPLAAVARSTAFALGYPDVYTVTATGDYAYPYAEDVALGVEGFTSTAQMLLDGYSDWSATEVWTDSVRTMRATITRGSPFVYLTRRGGDVIVTFSTTPTLSALSGNVLTATVNNHTYAIFGPTGASWNQPSSRLLTSTLNGLDYYSVALLPDSSLATLNFYKTYAYSFVTDTRVGWKYDSATAHVTSAYTVTTVPKEGPNAGTLMALYRHQWLNGASVNTAYSYLSSRGTMKVRSGSSFSTVMTYTGVLPILPNVGDGDRTRLQAYLNEAATTLFPTPPPGSYQVYWAGKNLNRLNQLIWIADQLGDTTTRDRIINAVKEHLQNWFTADAGEIANLFYYNSTWGAMIGYPTSNGIDSNLNDHHYNYSYFIQAASTVAHFDPVWAQDSNWGGMVRLLIRDVTSPDRADPLFPFLRTYEPYSGHNYAAGSYASGNTGNNEESSSQANYYAASLINWGSEKGDNTIRDLGIFMYTNLTVAAQQYWYDMDGQVLPPGYQHDMISLLWDNGGRYWTWFGNHNQPEYVRGIHWLPITGASLFMGARPGYNTLNYNELISETGGTLNYWPDLAWSFLALDDPNRAIAAFDANSNYVPEWAESKANTYHWLHNLRTLGHLETSVTANLPTAAVFNNAGNLTYAAYNAGASSVTVNFSDGQTMVVAARTLATSRRCNGTCPTATPTAIPTATTAPTATPTYAPVSPYNGSPATIPGTIQGEDFDLGGEGAAYHDNESRNNGGQYRPDEGVDISLSSGDGPGYGVTSAFAGEWLRYSVNVASSGQYSLSVRLAASGGGGSFHIERGNGSNLSGPISVPNTGGWATWQTVTVTGLSLSAGSQVLRLVLDGNGISGQVAYFNYLTFALIAPTSTATATTSSTATPTGTRSPSSSTTTATSSASGTATATATSSISGTATATATACAISFSDVLTSNIFYTDIQFLACRGVIGGFPNGLFQPNSNSTRGQFAKIATLGFGIAAFTPGTPTFGDVPSGNVFYGYVEAAYHAGVVNGLAAAQCALLGQSNPCYGLNVQISRAQVAVIVQRARSYAVVTPSQPTFSDVPAGNFAYAAVETLARRAIISGGSCASGLCFRPNDNIRRGELSKVVHRAIDSAP